MLVLGVDGGGTKTLGAVVGRDGALVALAAGSGTNPLDQPRWRDHLAGVVRSALTGVPPDLLVGAAFGLPVHGEVQALSLEQRGLVDSLVGGASWSASIRNDVHTAHEGAFAGGAGVLLLAGTGSMCWAADATGRHVRVGGWGDGFGDEGSAHWIGHAALSRTAQILDGRAEGPAFRDAILGATGVPRDAIPDGLLRWFYENPHRRPAVAAIARSVDRLASQGDIAAEAILTAAAEALALHVTTARQKLDLPAAGQWCFVGGVSRSAMMRRLLTDRLASGPAAPLLPPVGGAAWRAAIDAGWAPDPAWIGRLRAEMSQRLESQ